MLAGLSRESFVSTSSPADEVELRETADCNDNVLPPSSVAPSGRGEAATNLSEGNEPSAPNILALFAAIIFAARSSTLLPMPLLPPLPLRLCELGIVTSLSTELMLTEGLKGLGEPPSDGGEECGEFCELASVDVEPTLPSLSCLPPPLSIVLLSLLLPDPLTTPLPVALGPDEDDGVSIGLCDPDRSMLCSEARLGTGLKRLGDCLPGPVGVIEPPPAMGDMACRLGG